MPQFSALLERLYQQHRRECYYAGIIAATDVNIHGDGKRSISPMAFVPSVPDRDKERRERVKQNIRSLFMMRQPRDAQEAEIIKQQMITRLKAKGHSDAEELFNQVFPLISRGKR